MRFSKVVGKIDPKLVAAAEDKLSRMFLNIAANYTNKVIGDGLGGDPLIFSLMYPVEHVCTMSIGTAATDGKRYYWNPKFVLKLCKGTGKEALIPLRMVGNHEAWHSIYMHPSRRGSRLPRLWNIAVDYIVNAASMDDLKARGRNGGEEFSRHLGKYMTLPQLMEQFKDPFAPIKGFTPEELAPSQAVDPNVKMPHPNEDRELTPEQQKEMERREKRVSYFYADPDLEEAMRSPERIYDKLYALLPKCPECGSIGIYKLPKKDQKKEKKNEEEKQEKRDHQHGDGEECDCPHDKEGDPQDSGGSPGGCKHGGCSTCGHGEDGVDVFDLGGLVDDHLDNEETPEKTAKRIADAMAAARKMAGQIPELLERELGKLTAPKITWQDVIRSRMIKARAGNGRVDYTRFKTRPLFAGCMTPKKRNFFCKMAVLVDTSGSMSAQDLGLGCSQLAALDEKAELTVVCADASVDWNNATLLKKCSLEEISRLRPTGGGGTYLSEFFADYEKFLGPQDGLIVITDFFLSDADTANMKMPKVPVYWLCTSMADVEPPFGRKFQLLDK
jgi:predicted metal-dependent peptidase